ncbi:hypothetical protein OG884_13210 [Streptosporangium sp. NBC_01755]|uniref:hypothetical protein n=1 Tax=Streptosporangium sp. NBC_01755 TaxID=2975949 RepID=UPI002DDA4C04|nr:hypothetical protein [Streptosporangium sp. NBC_01755]WSD02814.1 hypothetical protein OG884_13210 [Streptosporangium sp. NBC_01755]
MGGNADETVPAGRPLESSPFPGDLDSELAARPPRRLATLTLVLGAGVMLVAGVIVGIQVQKAVGGTSGPSGPAGAPGAAMRQGTGPGGFGGGQQGGQGAGQGGQVAGPGGFGGGQQSGQGAGQGGQGAGQGGNGPGGGGRGGMTVGTVQRVDGGKVYLQTADGSVVTVNTTGETSVRLTKEGRVADLKPGGTVVVQGARAEDGSVAATAINEGGGRR